MFSADLLINRINTITDYTVVLADAIDTDQQDPTELPTVYVAYAGVTRIPQVPVNMEFLSQHGEDLVQLFKVKLVTTLDNYVANWQAVYMSLIDYTPTIAMGSTASSTNFAFVQSECVQSNGKVIDMSTWAVGFPSTNVIV